MTCKIYLEPRDLFDSAIVEDTKEKTLYCYSRIMDLLLSDTSLYDELLLLHKEERAEIIDEYYWYNIEPLKKCYNIDFTYENDELLGDSSWNTQT